MPFLNPAYVCDENPDGYHEGDEVLGDVAVDKRPGLYYRRADDAWAAYVPVPQAISRFQAMAALSNAGLLTPAQAAVTAAGGNTLLAWNNAQSFERSSPTIAALAAALNLTSAQVDSLFIAAAQVTA